MVRFAELPEGDSIQDPLVALLFADMVRYQKLLDEDDSQFARRAYIRGSFAYLEGHAHSLRTPLLGAIIQRVRHGDEIPLLEITALMNEVAEIGETGKIKKAKPKVATARHIAFVLRMYAGLFDYDANSFFAEAGWRELNSTIKARDRVTHPKSVEDLAISDEEMNSLVLALTWFINATLDPLRAKHEDDEAGEGA